MKRIEYLDLDIKAQDQKIILQEQLTIKCNCEEYKNHVLHNTNGEYNILIDLLLNLAEHLKDVYKNIQHNLIRTENLIETKNKTIDTLVTNLEYIKNQNNELLEKQKQENIKI